MAAVHVGLDQMEQQADHVIADLKTLGCGYAIVPWIGEDYRGNVDQARELAKRLNRSGQRLQKTVCG